MVKIKITERHGSLSSKFRIVAKLVSLNTFFILFNVSFGFSVIHLNNTLLIFSLKGNYNCCLITYAGYVFLSGRFQPIQIICIL